MLTDLPGPLAAFYLAVDAMDRAAYRRFFAPNAIRYFGNGDAVVGADTIAAQFGAFCDAHLTGLAHDFTGCWADEYSAALESNVTYTLVDGRRITLPCVTTLRFDDAGLIVEMRMFLDPSPLTG